MSRRCLGAVAVAGVAVGISLSGCSGSDSDSSATGGESNGGTKQVSVSPNLPDHSKCPSDLQALYTQYSKFYIDSPQTITEQDVIQAYVDYGSGSGCSLIAGADPKATGEAAASAICSGAPNTDLIQRAAVAQLEAVYQFLYGKGFGAVKCSQVPGTVVVDTDMLTGEGRYNPH